MCSCTAHNNIPKIKNVKVIFFPANMTSVIQPMDQGIIKSLKHFYRRLLVESIPISDFSNKKLNILHASRMCKQAWDKVSERTIMKCFHKAGFVKKETEGVNVVGKL
ncbi:hypothetical protein AVEN_257935-1 [Araneus ventricosus]|uniref:DDE-1 domain-containing protein n=1 Tax=Araneus ventricosus TaxID=182803 RepID=A0A4Y2SJ54_ARAVE|nr:hypothetical protein AVEN_257935-1 [Araneus ventricosus]